MPWPAVLVVCAIPLLVIGAATALFLRHRLYRYLERHHKALWLDLGSPTLLHYRNRVKGLNPITFVLRRQYKAVGDRELIELADTIRRIEIGYYLLFSLLVFMFFGFAAAPAVH